MIDTDRYDNEGIELSDGGTICFPESDGRMERIDKDGNSMEVRYQSNNKGQEWYKLFDTHKDLLAEVKRLRAELDHERNAAPGSVSNERIWEQIDRDDRLAAQRVRERLGIEVKETEGEGGYVKYPDPGCGLDSETGRFNMENHEWVNATERPWLNAVVAEVKRLRIWKEAFEHYYGKTEAKWYVQCYRKYEKGDEEE